MKNIWIIGVLMFAIFVSGCAGPTVTTPQPTPPQQMPTTTQMPTATQPTQAPTTVATTAPTATVQPTTASVDIQNYAFNPATLTIPRGTTVVWNQKDSVTHTVSGTGFDSGDLSPGMTFSHTFNDTGTYNYGCSIHTYMKGTIIVT